jgi:hypothetical protein
MVQSRYLRTAASLSLASGSVIAARPPEWPVGWKTRPRHTLLRWGLPFFTAKARYANTRPQKSRRATDNFPWSGWSSSFRGTEVRDEGEEASTSPPVRHPTTAVQENGTYGGQGKGAGAVRRLCCVNSAFLCSRSHRAKMIRDQIRMRLTSKRPVMVPHTAKRRKLRPRPARVSLVRNQSRAPFNANETSVDKCQDRQFHVARGYTAKQFEFANDLFPIGAFGS